MRINSTQTIAGVPLVKIRRLYREAGLEGELSGAFIESTLGIEKKQAAALCAALVSAGFLKYQDMGSVKVWVLTDEGVRLRCATAAKALHRKTADRLLVDLISRVEQLNGSSQFLAFVQRVTVFGSYVGHSERISDVDVAVELVPRIADHDELEAENSRRVAEAKMNGRSFSNFVDELNWWEREALLFLRNRKRGLSLQPGKRGREVAEGGPHRVVFERQQSSTN